MEGNDSIDSDLEGDDSINSDVEGDNSINLEDDPSFSSSEEKKEARVINKKQPVRGV